MTRAPDHAATFSLLKQLSAALSALFGPLCEIVIHDFADLEHSIIHIEGDVSQRSIGGAATNLLLTRVAHSETDEDLHNYPTTLPGGRTMKSSTVFLRDEDGNAYGAFCVNFEISAFASFRRLLGDFLDTDGGENVHELLSDDLQKTIESIIAETVGEKGLPVISREDKVNLIARLDAKGIFRVKKAVTLVADQLGLSRATVYNYLTEARDEEFATPRSS